MKKTGSLNITLKIVLGILAFVATFMFMKVAYADPTDYLESNYTGHISSADGTDLYSEPGTVNEKVYDANGDAIHLEDGTEIFIYGEERDDDLDVWYAASVVVEGTTYDGYIYTGRATRDAAATFTPTPTPEPTNTPTIAPEIESDEIATAAEASEDTKKMVEDSNTFEPWKWMIILFIAIIIFMLVYTIWVKHSEEQLEREMELYSGREAYQPLDGESEEDFESAKASYLDSIGLGNSGDDEAFTEEDYNDEFTSAADTQVSGSSLSELITSLQDKLGEEGNVDDEIDEVVDEPEFSFNDPEGYEANDDFDSQDINFGYDDPDAPAEAYANDYTNDYAEPVRETVAPTPVVPVAPVTPAATTGFTDEEGALRSKSLISGLAAGSSVVHAMYGVGTILDNSDPDIIKVKFGEDTRYLKKSKLAKAGLLKL